MTEKDTLSKEVEEQLQRLASDVSIQIEEKLTHILCGAIPKESSEQNRTLSEQILQLEKKMITLKEELDDERSKNEINEAKLIAHNAESSRIFSELQQENTSIKQRLAGEIEKQKNTQTEKLPTTQIASEEQELKEQQQKITILNKKLATLETQEQSLAERLHISESDLVNSQAQHQERINQLTVKNQELSTSLVTKKADIKSYQAEISSLKDQVTKTRQEQESILNRFNANREKQEKDNNKVRETIKYLRDENNEMINQINEHKEEAIEKINALEHKLTEYRLKFEYAQKQLTQNS